METRPISAVDPKSETFPIWLVPLEKSQNSKRSSQYFPTSTLRFHFEHIIMRLITFVLLALHGVQAAFVRRLDCDPSDTPSSINRIFEPISLSGGLGGPDLLFLKLSGDYPGSDGCEQLDGASADVLVDVEVLGRSVGYQIESNGSCPEVSPVGHLRYIHYYMEK